MSNELNELLNNYEKVIYGKEEISKPTIHQIHLLLDYIANLQQENQELKKQFEVGEQQYNDLVEEKEILQEQLSIKTLHLEELKLSKRDYTQENILTMQLELKNRHQKEFIEYLEYQVKLQEKLNDIHLATGFEEILSKYKEIIGVLDEKK